jgi:DNA-binding transcriptional LysR family regulator
MQNLEPILIFTTVADMGSFTHAADSLGIQKGRASTAVRKLEEDVGARLLHRTTRSVQLTEDGRAFHARARDLLAEVDDLHSMFAGDRVALRGCLRSIFRPRWRAQPSCRPCRISWRLTPSWSWRSQVRIGKSIWFKRGSTVYCGLDP